MISQDMVRHELLSQGTEDDNGLYEALWTLNRINPLGEGNENEAATREALLWLLGKGWIKISESRGATTSATQACDDAQARAAVLGPDAFASDLEAERFVFRATEEGARAYQTLTCCPSHRRDPREALNAEFFSDYGGDPALVLEGSRERLRELADQLSGLGTGRRHEVVVSGSHLVVMTVAAPGKQQGLRRIGPGDRRWSWSLPGELWSQIAEKVRALAEAPSGHQSFEAEGDEAIVIVSCGEFPRGSFRR